MRMKAKNLQKILIFIFVSLIAIAFLKSPGTNDVPRFVQWMELTNEYGLNQGYEISESIGRNTYPPLSFFIFFIVAKISVLLNISFFTGYKLAILFFLLLSTLIFYLWTRRFFLAILLQLTLTISSMALGYIDIYFTPFILLSLWALQRRKLIATTLLFSVAWLIKWQPVIIAPFVFVYLLNIRKLQDIKNINLKKTFFGVVMPFLLLMIILFSMFGFETINSLERGFSNPFLSGNALNFNWILTHIARLIVPDIVGGGPVNGEVHIIATSWVSVLGLPKLVFFLFFGLTFIIFLKSKRTYENTVLFCLIGYLTYFMFNSGVHENHLYLAPIFAIVLLYLNKNYLSDFLIWALSANINLILFYGLDGKGLPFNRAPLIDIALLFAIVNVLLFFVLFIRAYKKLIVEEKEIKNER